MRLDIAFTPAELAGADIAERVVVVVDVLRATSTIVEALANGARSVSPAPGIDEAVRVAQGVGRDRALLCGERRSLPIEGFDLGNSPREFTRERVEGKLVVLTTTNGTGAVLASASARRVLIGSFLNLGAVADALAGDGGAAVVVCAGRERRFALEDALCAGHLILRLAERGGALELTDSGVAAAELARCCGPDLASVMARSAGGRQLVEAGLEADVEYCATVDRHAVVPELHDRQITL
ncbi:MAG TPA: 2-phosphosulfolactate phosphatase [Longimicrobiales bacterium]